MWKYLAPVIVGVIVALFSEDIDKMFNGNKTKERKVLVFCGGNYYLYDICGSFCFELIASGNKKRGNCGGARL